MSVQTFTTRQGLARVMTLSLALCSFACDKGGDAKASEDQAEAEQAPKESELAKGANQAVKDIKADLDKGEDVKFPCAGNLGMYADLATSTDEQEKAAFAALQQVCYIDAPNKMIEALRAKMDKHELDTFDTVDLSNTIESEGFPADGEFAKVKQDAEKLLQVDIPAYSLKQAIKKATAEKEEGKSVLMGCIEGHQVVDKSGEKLGTDENAKKALDAFLALCPKEEG